MIEIHFDRLRTLGLTPALANLSIAAAAEYEVAYPEAPPIELLRLTEVHRETLRLHDGADELTARVPLRLSRRLAVESTGLAVGDWVLAATDPCGQIWVHARIPPLTRINRRDAEGRSHPVVSNVDTALLVMGLDDDFNPRRLERYLALVLASGGESGIVPAVVLTKVDVIAPRAGLLAERIEALRKRVPASIDLFAVDGTDPYTVQQLQPYLGAGQTLVVLGSSGAGKSTLTNTLLGMATQDTGAVRAHDSRGKHTTTSRSLHRLPCGACVIDTPGLRALRPDVGEATLAAAFGDIDALALKCRFRDCSHQDEPGCAVRQSVPEGRLTNYHTLRREARRDTLSALERQRQSAQWKARGRAGRERVRLRRDT